ncbi:hypothetical protein FKM82_020891 [Ascaphus truei]
MVLVSGKDRQTGVGTPPGSTGKPVLQHKSPEQPVQGERELQTSGLIDWPLLRVGQQTTGNRKLKNTREVLRFSTGTRTRPLLWRMSSGPSYR